MPARKADKTSKPTLAESTDGARRNEAAGSHDRQGKPSEGSGR